MGELVHPLCEYGCGRTLGCCVYCEDEVEIALFDAEVCCDECNACLDRLCGQGKAMAGGDLYWDCQQDEEAQP